MFVGRLAGCGENSGMCAMLSFINAIMKFDEVLNADYKDTLQPDILNTANTARGEACAQLKFIYDELLKKAESLNGLGLVDAANAFTDRANAFKSYIDE